VGTGRGRDVGTEGRRRRVAHVYLGKSNGVYDRASFISFPPSLPPSLPPCLPPFPQVNIANLTLGRQDADLALCLMSVDGEVPAAAVEQLKGLAQLNDVRTAKLGGNA